MKHQTQRAEIGGIYLHQTHLTIDDVISNELSDLTARQTVLEHDHQQTTGEY